MASKQRLFVLIAVVLAFLFPAARADEMKLAGTFTPIEVMERKIDLEGQLIRLKFTSRENITQVDTEHYSTYLSGDGSLFVIFPKEGLETMRKLSEDGSKGDSIYGVIRSSYALTESWTYSGVVLVAKGRTLSKATSGKAKLLW